MIPEGYRLLTAEDVGKVFGVDLESMVYFDEDVIPTLYLTSNGELNLTNFCEEVRDYLPYSEAEISSGIYLYGNTNDYIYYELAGRFWPTEADLSGVEITSFNTDYSWNDWFYVKDIQDPYNITFFKPKITINCKGKTMIKDLTITRELWDGSYEEISNGYTLTLDITTDALSDALYTYSINNGVTFKKFTNSNMVLEKVSKIIIKNDSGIYDIVLAYASGSVFGGVPGGTQGEFIIEEDTQWSISLGVNGGAN